MTKVSFIVIALSLSKIPIWNYTRECILTVVDWIMAPSYPGPNVTCQKELCRYD